VDKHLAYDLFLYVKSGDRLLEWQRLIPWINNFAAKKAKGQFNVSLAKKALGDYLMRDVMERSYGKSSARNITLDATTKLYFGGLVLAYLAPRIKRVAEKMRKVGLVKGKLVKLHPMYGRR